MAWRWENGSVDEILLGGQYRGQIDMATNQLSPSFTHAFQVFPGAMETKVTRPVDL